MNHQAAEFKWQELAERAQEVLILRYGLGGGPARSREEVAQALHISSKQADQIERQALEKLSGLDCRQEPFGHREQPSDQLHTRLTLEDRIFRGLAAL